MPLPLQIPFVNAVGVFWYDFPFDLDVTVRNMYLSLENSSVDGHETDF